ncbi:MAG: FISUMP domain-containing protein, partial [Maribacter sp.]|uniref:FISUMP domain-containing protein n=1 Tax=Maribacter sp. TaxID=1897614 RepID=UPI003C710E1D
ITETTASGGGRIYNAGKSTVTSRGICWATDPMPTLADKKTINGTGDGGFISELTNLTPNTTYHVRAYANNAEGISYGDNVTFTTKSAALPILQTTPISNVTSTSAKSGGTIVFEGKGSVTARGVCWSVNDLPTLTDHKTMDGMGQGVFTSTITGMDPDSTYYVRAYATNSEGTAYGNSVFLKPYKNTVTDVEGNVYATVTIGTQVWTAENLKTTTYQNGDPIENIPDNGLWNTTQTGAYCDYDNNAGHTTDYGRLYNWYAASDPRNIAPKGWHVATYDDYLVLIDELGGPFTAAEKMNTGVFKALPGGKRNRDGVFFDQGLLPYFWTATEYHEGSAWARFILLDPGELNIINLSKNYGFSVRCVRD